MSFQGAKISGKRAVLKPQTTSPTNITEGEIFLSDGSDKDAGMWIFQGGKWNKVTSTEEAAGDSFVLASNSGGMTAYEDTDTDFTGFTKLIDNNNIFNADTGIITPSSSGIMTVYISNVKFTDATSNFSGYFQVQVTDSYNSVIAQTEGVGTSDSSLYIAVNGSVTIPVTANNSYKLRIKFNGGSGQYTLSTHDYDNRIAIVVQPTSSNIAVVLETGSISLSSDIPTDMPYPQTVVDSNNLLPTGGSSTHFEAPDINTLVLVHAEMLQTTTGTANNNLSLCLTDSSNNLIKKSTREGNSGNWISNSSSLARYTTNSNESFLIKASSTVSQSWNTGDSNRNRIRLELISSSQLSGTNKDAFALYHLNSNLSLTSGTTTDLGNLSSVVDNSGFNVSSSTGTFTSPKTGLLVIQISQLHLESAGSFPSKMEVQLTDTSNNILSRVYSWGGGTVINSLNGFLVANVTEGVSYKLRVKQTNNSSSTINLSSDTYSGDVVFKLYTFTQIADGEIDGNLATYTNTSGLSTSSTIADFTGWTKTVDANNIFNGSTGVLTANKTGIVRASGSIKTAAATASYICLTDSSNNVLASWTSSTSQPTSFFLSHEVTQGVTYKLRISTTNSTSLSTSEGDNTLAIEVY